MRRHPQRQVVDVDGMVDPRGVRFIGNAHRTATGAYRCLADVDGAFCVVEVRIRFGRRRRRAS